MLFLFLKINLALNCDSILQLVRCFFQDLSVSKTTARKSTLKGMRLAVVMQQGYLKRQIRVE